MTVYGFDDRKKRFCTIDGSDFGKVSFEEVAPLLAYTCVHVPDILGIEVFGSMARDGKGDDLDLIILVTESNWQKFRALVSSLTETSNRASIDHADHFVSASARRFAVMEEVLGEDLGRAFQAFEVDTDVSVDVFLFPQDWKSRLGELQAALPHEDPNFMVNIFRDVQSLEGLCSED